MFKRSSLIGVMAAFSLGLPTWAATNKEDYEQIVKAIEKDLSTLPADRSVSPGRPDVRQMIIPELQSAIARGDKMQILSAIDQASIYAPSEAVRKQCEDLAAQLRAEQAAETERKVAEIEKVYADAAQAIRSARKASDLDATLDHLKALGNQRNEAYSSASLEEALNKAEPAARFVAGWQDYLFALSQGDANAASEDMRNLAEQDLGTLGLIPRSEILQRIAAPASAAKAKPDAKPDAGPGGKQIATAIIERIKTPADLAKGLKDLRNLDPEKTRDISNDLGQIIALLAPLERAYEMFNAGGSMEIETDSTIYADYPDLPNPSAAIRMQLIVLVLPRYLGLPPDAKVKPGESPVNFLRRVQAEAGARGDYQLAAKAADTEELLSRGNRDASPQNTSQASLFVTGNNQEAAGQYALAVLSYQRALARPAIVVPAKVIGDRLTAIQTAHPTEYDHGFKLYLSPPQSAYLPPGYPVGMNYQMQQQMMRQRGMPSSPPLTVPAASPAPTAQKNPTPTPPQP